MTHPAALQQLGAIQQAADGQNAGEAAADFERWDDLRIRLERDRTPAINSLSWTPPLIWIPPSGTRKMPAVSAFPLVCRILEALPGM
jgi:hypothetical protein